MIDSAMHAKQSAQEDPVEYLPRFTAADNISTGGVTNGYQPGGEDLAPEVAITSFKIPSE